MKKLTEEQQQECMRRLQWDDDLRENFVVEAGALMYQRTGALPNTRAEIEAFIKSLSEEDIRLVLNRALAAQAKGDPAVQ